MLAQLERQVMMHPFIKLFIFSLVISALGCVTAPKVTDIAELHHGDKEDDVVERIGRGHTVVSYHIDDIDYHYRSYKTRHTNDDYALLFANRRLVAVLQSPVSLDNCITLEQQADWGGCLQDHTTQMLDDAINIGFHDFSEAIAQQKQEQAEITGNTAAAAVIVVPSMVVAWPFAAMCGGVMATGALIDTSDSSYEDCLGILPDITEKTDLLITRYIGESVLIKIEAIHPEYVINKLDNHRNDRRIFSRRWGCGRMGASDDALDVRISIGLIDRHIMWAKLESKWQ